jgi:3-phenylpropionate/trans-cinnamate dioxygenase ferredoxin subunit
MSQRHLVTTLDRLPPGTMKAFSVATHRIVLFNVDGRIYALEDRCTHEGAPLSEGMLDGTTIVCPWHNAEFDVACGKVLCRPAVENVQSYPVFLNGDQIEIDV